MAKKTQRELAEQLLDNMAQIRSLQTGESFGKAYLEVSKTDEGRELYALHSDASAEGERAPRGDADAAAAYQKHAGEAREASDDLDRLAASMGGDYRRAIHSPEGRRLYGKFCLESDAARRAVSR